MRLIDADNLIKEMYEDSSFPLTLADKVTEKIDQQRVVYANDWISCSSGILPKEHDSIFAKLKGTDKWKSTMFEKISDEVYVTIVDDRGSRTTAHAHTVDGKWSCELLKCNKSYRVIAWQPLPSSYEMTI